MVKLCACGSKVTVEAEVTNGATITICPLCAVRICYLLGNFHGMNEEFMKKFFLYTRVEDNIDKLLVMFNE